MLRSQSGTELNCCYIILCNLASLALRYKIVCHCHGVFIFVTHVTVCAGSSNASCTRPQELEG